MPSEAVLRMRIADAVREAERANANRDERAYNRARAKYEAADKWLTKLENERNERALLELESQARNGELSYGHVQRAGVPFEVLHARGWANMPDKAGLRRTGKPHTSAGKQAGEVKRHDDAAEPDRKDPEHDSGGECA
jgi:hypothetical protein